MDEIYISTDTETDGPIPGQYSMLSFASAAYSASPERKLLGTFYANLETLPGAVSHPDTMAWWQKHQDAWQASRENLQEPGSAMKKYLDWINGLSGKPVFVGFPAAFDFMFVQWYLFRFTGESPFGHSALDIKTYAMAALKVPYSHTTKRYLPRRWFGPHPHTHQALDDAIEQGGLFLNMLAERQSDQD